MKLSLKKSGLFLPLFSLIILLGCVEKLGSGGFPLLEDTTVLENVRNNPSDYAVTTKDTNDIIGHGTDTMGKFSFNSTYVASYLRKITTKLEKQWPFEVPEYSIKLIYGDHINAHATSRNTIYFPSGWLHGAESEDEIAAVLAHELAHILLKHPMDNIDQEEISDAVNSLQKGIVLGMYLKDMSLGKSGGNVNFQYGGNASEQRDLALASWAGENLYKSKVNLLDPLMTRYQEEEADFLAVDLLMAAGYNPLPFRDDVMDRLKSSREQQLKKLEQEKVEFRKQQNALSESIGNSLQGGNIENAGTIALNGFFNEINRGFDELYTSGQAKHFEPTTRSKTIKAYLKSHYPSRKDYPPKTRTELEQTLKKSGFNTVQENHIKSDIAGEQLSAGDIQSASTLGLQPLRTIANKSPYPWYVLGAVRSSQGRFGDAKENYLKTIHLNGPPEAYAKLARIYFENRQFTQAKHLLDKGVKKYLHDYGPFYESYALLYRAKGDYDGEKRILAECKKYPSKIIVVRCEALEEVSKQYFGSNDSLIPNMSLSELLNIDQHQPQTPPELNEVENSAWETFMKIFN